MRKVKREVSSMAASLLAEKIANNDDLLDQILDRLPIKSLIRLQSVSKHWLSLVSTVYSRRNTRPNSASGLIMFCNSYTFIDFIDFNLRNTTHFKFSGGPGPLKSLPFLESNAKEGIDLLHACNGLLLFRTLDRNFYVANPTTKQCMKLPRPPSLARNNGCFIFNLAYDHCKSKHYFKVVCVTKSGYGSHKIDIYSSQTGRWKHSGFFNEYMHLNLDDYDGCSLGGVFWNGAIHWIRVGRLVYFNVEEGVLNIKGLPLPRDVDNMSKPRINWYFEESRDHLLFIATFLLNGFHDVNPEFDIYELERDYSKWTFKFHVDLRESVLPFVPKYNGIFHIIFVAPSKKDEESYMVLQTSGILVVYYYKTQTLTQIVSHPSRMINLPFQYFYPYIESVARLNLNADQ